MTETTLRQKVRHYNTMNLVLGILLIPGSIAAWFVSFYILRTLFYIPLNYLGSPFLPHWDMATVSHYVALGSLALLAVEGMRHTRDLFDLKDYSQSAYSNHQFTGTSTGRAMSIYFGNPASYAYFISQILFLAPQTTLQATRLLIGRLPQDDATIRAAVRILNELAEDRQWVARGKYHADASSVSVLQRLKLIWTRDEQGFAQIRIPPRA